MRIIQIIPEFCFGGAQTMCANLSVELHNMGHDVTAVSLYTKETALTENLSENGVRVVYMDKKPGADIGCIFRLYQLIRHFQPDVVHSHIYAGKYAHIAATLAGVRSKVHTVHSVAQKEASPSDKRMNHILFKLLGVIPVALTEEVKKTIEDVYKISDAPIAWNGIPLEKCKPIVTYPVHATTFVHVGRFCEVKNHSNLIRGFVKAHRRYPEIQLKLYGDGPLRQDMERLVSELQAEDYIHFMGPTNDVYGAMAKADVFVLPSIYEGMPMTLIEAMGTGLPIVATAVGGVPDMLEDGREAIFTETDAESIADRICMIADHPELRQSLGQNALVGSGRFSAEAMARNYLEIYQRR